VIPVVITPIRGRRPEVAVRDSEAAAIAVVTPEQDRKSEAAVNTVITPDLITAIPTNNMTSQAIRASEATTRGAITVPQGNFKPRRLEHIIIEESTTPIRIKDRIHGSDTQNADTSVRILHRKPHTAKVSKASEGDTLRVIFFFFGRVNQVIMDHLWQYMTTERSLVRSLAFKLERSKLVRSLQSSLQTFQLQPQASSSQSMQT
jgi:hypothetical protein